jgi:hypothetical protein
MTDNDLIRRGDAMRIVDEDETAAFAYEQLRALPATDPLADPRVKALVEALRAVEQHEVSVFFGPDAEKNRRASWRGVMRKVKAALAYVDGEKT